MAGQTGVRDVERAADRGRSPRDSRGRRSPESLCREQRVPPQRNRAVPATSVALPPLDPAACRFRTDSRFAGSSGQPDSAQRVGIAQVTGVSSHAATRLADEPRIAHERFQFLHIEMARTARECAHLLGVLLAAFVFGHLQASFVTCWSGFRHLILAESSQARLRGLVESESRDALTSSSISPILFRSVWSIRDRRASCEVRTGPTLVHRGR